MHLITTIWIALLWWSKATHLGLWGGAHQKRYPQASVNQVSVALAMQNPEAFPAGDVRQVKLEPRSLLQVSLW